MTGGAGMQHFAARRIEAAAFSRRDRLRGRCMIQTWSRSSTATPATWPSVQLFGSGFGQNGSTSNFGTSAATTMAVQAMTNAPARNSAQHETSDQVAHVASRTICSFLLFNSNRHHRRAKALAGRPAFGFPCEQQAAKIH